MEMNEQVLQFFLNHCTDEPLILRIKELEKIIRKEDKLYIKPLEELSQEQLINRIKKIDKIIKQLEKLELGEE